MADIPVEKKSRPSWLLWLLGLLVLALVLWLLAELFTEDGEDVDTTTAIQTEAVERGAGAEPSEAAAEGVITSVAVLLDAESPQQLAGREVELSSMAVTSVLGDSAFYASPQGDDRRFLVALNEVIPSPPEGVEGRYDVTEGQVIDIMGGVRALTAREPEAWGLSEQEAQAMMNDRIYIRAQKLNIVEAASD